MLHRFWNIASEYMALVDGCFLCCSMRPAEGEARVIGWGVLVASSIEQNKLNIETRIDAVRVFIVQAKTENLNPI